MTKSLKGAKRQYRVRNLYKGWCPQNGNKSWLERIDAECISPKQFYNRYVKRRMPVILRSNNVDCLRSFSIDAMQAIAGDCKVVVEKADPHSYHQFGRTDSSSRKSMLFGDFLSRMEQEYLYCTTQPLPEDKRGPKQITSSHIQRFIDRGMIPQNLPIMGNLQLYQINAWIGCSEDGSSSGFHHDFHDNFYLLVSGEKQFRLASPNFTSERPTYGCKHNPEVMVHPNGLISYMGACIREDGARKVDVLRWKYNNSEGSLKDEIEEQLQDAVADEMLARVGFKAASQAEHPLSFCVEPTAHGEYITETLRAGEMLYLPASFYHEVISFSGDEDKHHMAINYWYYPPSTSGTFESPYEDDFWKARWETLAFKDKRKRRLDMDRMRRRKLPLRQIYTKDKIRAFINKVETAKRMRTN